MLSLTLFLVTCEHFSTIRLKKCCLRLSIHWGLVYGVVPLEGPAVPFGLPPSFEEFNLPDGSAEAQRATLGPIRQ